MDQIFALQQIFEKSWEYAKEVNACFVDFEKACDRIPRDKLWAVLLVLQLLGGAVTVWYWWPATNCYLLSRCTIHAF